jgi:hypothetical protein
VRHSVHAALSIQFSSLYNNTINYNVALTQFYGIVVWL